MTLALAGYTIGVTAARRAEEQARMLHRHGARVVHAPAVQFVPLGGDEQLIRATRDCLAEPLDDVIVTTAMGLRSWLEAAGEWSWNPGLGERLAGARLLARGAKARGAIRGAGLACDAWLTGESSTELRDHLLAQDLRGRRIAVQLHGEPQPEVTEPLRDAGATVIEVAVYRWTLPDDLTALHQLIEDTVDGRLAAVTFTSAPAATALLRAAARADRQDAFAAALNGGAVAACVGEVTAAPLEAVGITTLQPPRPRLGPLVRSLAEAAASWR